MKDLVKRAVGGMPSIAGLYGKLSRTERALCWCGLGLLVLLVALFGVWGGTGEWRVVLRDDGDGEARAQRLAAELSRQGIPPPQGRTETGRLTIEVPAGTDHGAALEIAGRETVAEAGEESWVDAAPSLLDTPERLEARRSAYNQSQVKRAILWNKKIEKVSLTVAPPPRVTFLRRPDEGASAAVALSLKPGAGELSRGEAEAIRDLVRCAFAIRPDRIALTDSSSGRLLSPAGESPQARVEEREENVRKLVSDGLIGIYRRLFAPDDFSISVLISLSQERKSVEREEVDREKSFPLETESTLERGGDLASGGVLTVNSKAVTISETVKSKVFPSLEKTKIDVPPGELEAVTVSASFDLDAVMRVESGLAPGAGGVPSREDRLALVQSFTEREQGRLRAFLSLFESVSASIVVLPFSRRPSEPPVEPAAAVVAEPALAAGDAVGRNPWAAIFALGLVLSAVVVLWISIARRRPLRLSSSLRPGAGRLAPLGEGPGDGLLDSVGRLSERVRERPDVAASILRVWLQQDGVEAREEAVPS